MKNENIENQQIDASYEILIMMSDQHSGQICRFAGDPVVRTPNLDKLAATGVCFTEAYTPCPLCVPARAGFMTGRYPFSVGVADNAQAIASHEPTFAHSLNLGGYETTLIGRMHFNGLDQLHGFDKRVGKDICTIQAGMCFTGAPGLQFDYSGADLKKIYTAENNASYQYDQYVVQLAKQYLGEYHDQKQAIVVGTYMPHMPLGADADKVEYYRDKVKRTLQTLDVDYACSYLNNQSDFAPDETEKMIECRANYYAMIEKEDELVGEVYEAYRAYLKRKGTKGIFAYVSDHGDHMGDRRRIGKQTFFEKSSKIPMIIAGDGISHQVIDTPVSLLDLTYTLCEIGGGMQLPHADGRSLMPALRGEKLEARPVISECLGKGKKQGKKSFGYMIRKDDYKLISYTGFENEDLLFNLKKDPEETVNIISENKDIAEDLRQILKKHMNKEQGLYSRLLKNVEGSSNNRLVSAWGKRHPHFNDHATWIFGTDE